MMYLTIRNTYPFSELDFVVNGAQFVEVLEVQLDESVDFLMVVLGELAEQPLLLRARRVLQQ